MSDRSSTSIALAAFLLAAHTGRLEAAEKTMIELTTDLPKSIMAKESIVPFKLSVKNTTNGVLVFERVRSLTEGADLEVSLVNDVPPQSKRPVSVKDRLNLFRPRSTREFTGVLRLSPGRHTVGLEVVVALHTDAFLKSHVRTITGRPLSDKVSDRALGEMLDPEIDYFVTSQGDAPGKRTIARDLRYEVTIQPNPTVEKLRSQIKVVEFVDGLPPFGLVVRDDSATYHFRDGKLTRIGSVTLGALKRMSHAFSKQEEVLVFVIRPGPGRSLERTFGTKLSVPESEALIAATDDMTYGLPRFAISRETAGDLFRTLEEDKSTLSETGGGKLIVSSR